MYVCKYRSLEKYLKIFSDYLLYIELFITEYLPHGKLEQGCVSERNIMIMMYEIINDFES